MRSSGLPRRHRRDRPLRPPPALIGSTEDGRLLFFAPVFSAANHTLTIVIDGASVPSILQLNG